MQGVLGACLLVAGLWLLWFCKADATADETASISNMKFIVVPTAILVLLNLGVLLLILQDYGL